MGKPQIVASHSTKLGPLIKTERPFDSGRRSKALAAFVLLKTEKCLARCTGAKSVRRGRGAPGWGVRALRLIGFRVCRV